VGQRFGIAVHAEHAGPRLQEGLAVPPAAERPVDDELALAGRHPLAYLLRQYGEMVATRRVRAVRLENFQRPPFRQPAMAHGSDDRFGMDGRARCPEYAGPSAWKIFG